jgi:hypothetical protein
MAANIDAVVRLVDLVPKRSEGPETRQPSGSSAERPQAPATTRGHRRDKPQQPAIGRTAATAGGEPPRYPPVEGGGDVPFTPDHPPEVTDERLDHIMVGEPRRRGQAWSGGHGYGAGKGKAEFPRSWAREVVKAAIDQILTDPRSIASIRRRGSKLEFRGTANGLPIVVVVRGRHGPPKLRTAYPEQTP